MLAEPSNGLPLPAAEIAGANPLQQLCDAVYIQGYKAGRRDQVESCPLCLAFQQDPPPHPVTLHDFQGGPNAGRSVAVSDETSGLSSGKELDAVLPPQCDDRRPILLNVPIASPYNLDYNKEERGQSGPQQALAIAAASSGLDSGYESLLTEDAEALIPTGQPFGADDPENSLLCIGADLGFKGGEYPGQIV